MIAIKTFMFREDVVHSVGIAWLPKPGTEGNETVLVVQLYLTDPKNGLRTVSLREDTAQETIDLYCTLARKLSIHIDEEELAKELGVDLAAKPQTPPSPHSEVSNSPKEQE